MINGQRSVAKTTIEMPERKLAAGEEEVVRNQKMEASQVVLRVACLISSVVAISKLTTAKQTSTISAYGFIVPITSKWSFYDSFLYLVGVSAAAAIYSMIHLFISASRFIGKIPTIPSRIHLWLSFAGDQILALAMMSVGSSALGLQNVNRAGVQHLPFPDACTALLSFCNHVAITITLTFFGFFLLASSVVVDVIWLCYL